MSLSTTDDVIETVTSSTVELWSSPPLPSLVAAHGAVAVALGIEGPLCFSGGPSVTLDAADLRVDLDDALRERDDRLTATE